MYNIIFSKKAVNDLSEIWNYTAKNWSIRQANYYYNFIISFCKSIGKNPVLLGIKYDEVIDGLLGCKVKKHVIFYRIKNNEILIIRILYERMDFKQNFK